MLDPTSQPSKPPGRTPGPMAARREAVERPLLSVRGLTKRFPGVTALDGVSLDLHAGEVHALVGENGAGKSTLIKILAGAIQLDAGELVLDGAVVSPSDPSQARRLGVTAIYQEGSLVGQLTVVDNMFLGQELTAPRFFADRRRMAKRAREVLDEIAPQVDLARKVNDLPPDHRQLVEIARSLLSPMRVLILDEPTSSLTEAEVAPLFAVIDRLTASGVAVLYVTHRLAEVQRISHTVSVLRDGRLVATRPTSDVTIPDLIRMMIGRELTDHFPKVVATSTDTELLRLRSLSRGTAFDGIDLVVRQGEIVGVAGLEGAGQSDVLRAVAGDRPPSGGTIELLGVPVQIDSPAKAIGLGIAYIPADRKKEGIVPALSVRSNLSLAALRLLSRWGIVRGRSEDSLYQRMKSQLDIRTSDPAAPMHSLSGGNQQKVLLGRAIAGEAKLFVFDQPTRGIDVGAKSQIYQLLRELVDQKAGVLLFSSELEEVLGLCDVVYVMRGGRIGGKVMREEASEETVMRLAFGEDPEPRSAAHA